MLRELSVQNLALIEDVRVELDEGFCAWTGETGAGKSLLLTALSLVLGGKASAELVRAGKAEARAAAVFEVEDAALRREIETILGGPLEDDSLIITRRVSAQSRSTAQVNGMPVTIGTLQRLGEQLVDIHGQTEGRALLDPDRQRGLLDAFGKLDDKLLAYRRAQEPSTKACDGNVSRSWRRPKPASASGPCLNSSATSWPEPILESASTMSSFANRTCWPMPNRFEPPRPKDTTCCTRPTTPLRRSSNAWPAASGHWRSRYQNWPRAPQLSNDWLMRPARSPTACATWARSGTTIRSGSKRSKPAWHSTESSPRGSTARPMSSCSGVPRPRPGSRRSRETRPT